MRLLQLTTPVFNFVELSSRVQQTVLGFLKKKITTCLPFWDVFAAKIQLS